MSEAKLSVYTVYVCETREFCDSVEVVAKSERQALERAMEQFQCEWSNSNQVDIDARVLAKEAA